MRLSLRDYQQTLVEQVRAVFRAGKRAPLVVAPTGAGKTVLFSYITDGAAAKGRRVWILVHRSELLDQTSRTLAEIGVGHGLIAAGESMNQVEAVQVASVQTLCRRLESVVPPDLIITDECHHSVAGTYKKITDAFPRALHLGVTATPERVDGRGLGEVFDCLIRGPEVADLMARGFLSRPAYFCPPPQFDASSIRTTAGDFNRHDAEVVLDKPRIVGDAVAHYGRICPGAPAIAFCVSVAHAQHVAEAFRAAGFRAASIDGTLSDFERRDLIASLGDGRLHVLTSCEIISEGTDIPVVTTGILLRPTQSLGLHLQQVGRVLRPVYAKGMPTTTNEERLAAIAAGPKPRAVILDHVGNCLRHGLAEEQRDWSLDGQTAKKKKKRDGEAGDRVMQCKACFGTFLPASKCPHCGKPTATGGGREVEQVAGELVELVVPQLGVSASGAAFRQCPKCTHVHSERLEICPKCGRDHAAAEGRAKRAEQGSAQTFAELIAIGKKRGMKNPHGWAAHVFRARHGRTPTAEERGAIPAAAL
jgi:superfamily II DNA or RNA helicase